MRRILVVLLCLFVFACSPRPEFPVPDGFVLQPLDPTDGRIAKPKDWFYFSSGTPSGWQWIISEEDASKGPYETGLRMQMLIGIKKNAERTPEAFAKGFLDSKRQSAKVLRECPEEDQGMFVRQCLEVLESVTVPTGTKQYRILYSAFWGKDLDLVIVNTFGSPPEKWDSLGNTINVMSRVELIGPNFLKEHPKN